MTDMHSREIRIYNLSQIKATNTKPEILVRKFLYALGFYYTLHNKKLAGKPDIALPKDKTIIFIHACLAVGRVASGMDLPIVNILLFQKKEPGGG